jgi:hypothetical protein
MGIHDRSSAAVSPSSTRSARAVVTNLAHRWPTAVGLLAAIGMFLTGADRTVVALVVAIAATCYVAAATFGQPWMAWAWIPLSFVVAAVGWLVELDPIVATAVSAGVLVVVGLLRGSTRPAVTLETAGLLVYGALAVGALLLAPAVGLVVVALTLVAHGLWDVWHLREHRNLVSPSLAEACVALDIPLGLAVLVTALA